MRSWRVSPRTRSSHRPVGVVDDRTLDDRVRRIFAVVQSERTPSGSALLHGPRECRSRARGVKDRGHVIDVGRDVPVARAGSEVAAGSVPVPVRSAGRARGE